MTDRSEFNIGMWFDDFEPGQSMVSDSRTVLESDVVSFAELTGYENPIHLNAEFAMDTTFGQRVVHKLLVLPIAVGLLVKTGLLDGTIDAFREIRRCKFKKPVFINDSIRVKMTVRDTQLIRGLKSGLVKFGINVINQDNAAVMTGQLSVLMKVGSA